MSHYKMCGIFACLNCTEPVDSLKTGCNKIQHRGPDHSSFGVVPNTNHVYGFHRLSINDLTEKGNQPLVHQSHPHIKVICNGEIYNHNDLKKIYNFKTYSGSDCEIILHLYQRFGIERTVQELDGYFAFILFDNDNVFVARDEIGVRSLYIGNNGNSVYISSELKAIHPYCKEVFPFPNGHIWAYSNETKSGEYTCYKKEYNMSDDTYQFALSTTKKLLEDAVKKRVDNTERPIGCLLSGGLDSSLISSLVCKYSNQKVHTFSIGLAESIDLKYARMVADHLQTIHHEVIVTEDELLAAIPDVIKQIETYDTTTVRASTPMYLLCKYISDHTDIKVIFSGEGADELSGSYLYFKNAPSLCDFYKETHRLTSELQYFDVLRCDKSTAAHGLEVRVPFLDKEFMNYYLYINPQFKYYSSFECEKYLLRDAFRDMLPDEVLWRTKEAFSDGISKKSRSWYEIIQDHVSTLNLPDVIYEYNPPASKETQWYRSLFDTYYPNCEDVLPYYWLPKWCGDVKNPSARVLSSYL